MFVPADRQVEMWAAASKLSPDYGKAWMDLKVTSTIKKWNGHPHNTTFSASAVDPGLLPLAYKDLQAQEKHMVFLQGCSGAMAAVGTRILSLIEGEVSLFV